MMVRLCSAGPIGVFLASFCSSSSAGVLGGDIELFAVLTVVSGQQSYSFAISVQGSDIHVPLAPTHRSDSCSTTDVLVLSAPFEPELMQVSQILTAQAKGAPNPIGRGERCLYLDFENTVVSVGDHRVEQLWVAHWKEEKRERLRWQLCEPVFRKPNGVG